MKKIARLPRVYSLGLKNCEYAIHILKFRLESQLPIYLLNKFNYFSAAYHGHPTISTIQLSYLLTQLNLFQRNKLF